MGGIRSHSKDMLINITKVCSNFVNLFLNFNLKMLTKIHMNGMCLCCIKCLNFF